MNNYVAFSGVVTEINDFSINDPHQMGCYKTYSIDDGHGNVVNFIVAPTTYFLNQEIVSIGDTVTGFYGANEPAPLIFPPQFNALLMCKVPMGEFVTVEQFDPNLVNREGTLQLNVNPDTPIFLQNGQPFTGSLANRELLVVYSATTRSIPAQTTPSQIVVICP